MKLTCLQENLNKGLQITGHLVNKNINLPILNNVLLEVKEGSLKLSSTNLEIGITCFVRCKTEKEGIFTVEAKLLSDYVNLLPNEQINIELSDSEYLKVNCKNHNTKIKGIDASDFPVIPQLEQVDGYKVNAENLKKSIQQVIFAITPSESRPEISGVYMDFNNLTKGALTIVGTDSYRLAEKTIELLSNTEEKNVIVPMKTLQEVLRILNTVEDEKEMEIFLSENQILFKIGAIEVISRLIEGQYPDYKQIIPQETNTKIIVSTQALIKTIKTVALFSKTGIFDIELTFDSKKGLIVEATNTQIGESKSEIEVEFEGDENKTVLNYRYLLEGLNNLDSEEVEISLVDNSVPCLIKPKGKGDYLYIIMPIKQ